MKTAQYVRQEKAIASAEAAGIRERWMWGLRLLRDPEAMASEKSLRHGVADQLVAAAKAAGLKLSVREIQRRIQCARTYKTEAEIRRVTSDFETWFDLLKADFPAYEIPEGEPPADHRTEAEKLRDLNRQFLELTGGQESLFPLDQFEPTQATLKQLHDYADQQEELTGRFVAHDKKRREYLGSLDEAAGHDLSMTWQDALSRLPS